MKKGSSLLLASVLLLAALGRLFHRGGQLPGIQNALPGVLRGGHRREPGEQRHLRRLRRHHRQLLEQRLRHLH